MRGRILDAVEQAERRLVFGDASPRMFEQRAWRTTGPPLRVRGRPKNKVTRGQPAKPAAALRRPKYCPAARRLKDSNKSLPTAQRTVSKTQKQPASSAAHRIKSSTKNGPVNPMQTPGTQASLRNRSHRRSSHPR